jgi:hypothetical protein
LTDTLDDLPSQCGELCNVFGDIRDNRAQVVEGFIYPFTILAQIGERTIPIAYHLLAYALVKIDHLVGQRDEKIDGFFAVTDILGCRMMCLLGFDGLKSGPGSDAFHPE